MSDNSRIFNEMVPLSRVVGAAAIDIKEDFTRVEHLLYHYAARGLKKLSREVLHPGIRRALVHINKNTRSATMPLDCLDVIRAYAISGAVKVPLIRRNELYIEKGVVEVPCEDKCPVCNQNKNYCEDLKITETVESIIINGSTYDQTIIKKLYPDGRYYLETKIPVLDINTEEVVYVTKKEFITQLDVSPCGCIEQSESNTVKIKKYCNEAYCYDCAPVQNNNFGGYNYLHEENIIQLDYIGDFTKVLVVYRGYIPKKNGQYMVPEVAFETLVSWVMYMYNKGRRSVPVFEKEWYFNKYKIERENMDIILGRVDLSYILNIVGRTPKFDIDNAICDPIITEVELIETGSASGNTVDSGSAVVQYNNPVTSGQYIPYEVSASVGSGSFPITEGVNYYQNDKLKNAINLQSLIFVNNNPETKRGVEWEIDTVNGILYRYQGDGVTPNVWQDGDKLVIPTFFKLSS